MGIRQLALIVFLSWAASCGDAPGEASKTDDTVVLTDTDTLTLLGPKVLADSTIIRFLVSESGTYGWQTTAEPISLDFFPDGRLHIQGPDGEATMWQGSWKLKDGVIVLDRKDLGVEESFPVVIHGDSLQLGARVYTRYRP